MKHIQSNFIVADFGCDVGRIARYIAPKVRKLICTDICDRFLEMAKGEMQYENVEFVNILKFKYIGDIDFCYCY